LNEDLAREYQAIIAYVVYSQVLTGAEYMDIAARPAGLAASCLRRSSSLSQLAARHRVPAPATPITE
jgi:bacterioferritin